MCATKRKRRRMPLGSMQGRLGRNVSLRSRISSPTGLAGLVGWYTASSWTGSQWSDSSGYGNNATTIRGSIFKDNTGINGLPYLYGTSASGILFPGAILPSIYTLFHVARYNGSTRLRIFDGGTGVNWLSGFHAGQSGKAYHFNWITPQADVHGTNWVVSTDQNALYRSNKVDRTIAAPGAPSYAQLSINYGNFVSTESSDWACAEIIVYSRTLTVPEIESVEIYLYDKYGH